MKSRLIMAFVFLLGAFSCKDSKEVCGAGNPVENLPWLKEYIDQNQDEWDQSEIYDVDIYQATYGSDIVFYVSYCCPACDFLPPLIINCSGDTLGNLGNDIPFEDLINRAVIWEVDNGVCN